MRERKMVRYLLTAASVFAMMSGVALAETAAYDGSNTKTTIIRTAPEHAMGSAKTVTKRYVNHRGNLVTKKKTYSDGFSGGSVSRSKTVTDPALGGTITKSHTTIER
jgi:hypothetical protein